MEGGPTTPVGVMIFVELMLTAAVIWRRTALNQLVQLIKRLLTQNLKQSTWSACLVAALVGVEEGLTLTVGVTRCVCIVGTAAVTGRLCVLHMCCTRWLGMVQGAGMVVAVQTGVEGWQTVTAGVISCVGRGVTAAVTGRRCVWYRLVLLLRLHQ